MTTSFENSSMKSSFSLSSLRTGSGSGAGATQGRLEPSLERPYHSLTKKRKEPCREAWRRSWGSAASGGSAGDDLWPLLQHHYDYIMDNQIIDSCREANGELTSLNTAALPISGNTLNRQWSLNQLIAEFNELCLWLTSVQEEIYSSPENLSNRSLRVRRMAELISAEQRRSKFIEQAAAILERIPEAREEVTWRVEHLNSKWEGVRLLLSPEQGKREGETANAVDTAHELRCLRRWLHGMEGRLPPPSVAPRSAPQHEIRSKLRYHQVLQRDVECHGRIVSWVVRLCDGCDAARALERRWHLLYLRAIEWLCHLEACLARIETQCGLSSEVTSDSDEEPALKQPRLSRKGSPRRLQRTPERFQRTPELQPVTNGYRTSSGESDESYSEEEQDDSYLVVYKYSGSETDCELACFTREDGAMMSSETRDTISPNEGVSRVPGDSPPVPSPAGNMYEDVVDGVLETQKIEDVSMYDSQTTPQTPPTVIKRKKPKDSSKFNQSNRKSKNCATFYFRHHDTDSDRQMIETDGKSQEDTSEEEWTYVGGIANEDSTDLMTSSIEIQCDILLDQQNNKNGDANVNNTERSTDQEMKTIEETVESITPDLLKLEHRKEDIDFLVNQAEELVQKQAQQQMSVKKCKIRSIKPLNFDEDGKVINRTKMSRIKEWLKNNTDGTEEMQCTESYDASGEYTTESEVEHTSLTSEERNIHSSMDMSTSTCTVTPTHHAKVTLRKKRNTNSTRPWSVSCLSQLTNAIHDATASGTSLDTPPTCNNVYERSSAMSESALNTLTSPAHMKSNSKLKSSTSSVKTTVQGQLSSSNTINEACASCYEINELKQSQSSLRRKRLKLRRKQIEESNDPENKKFVKRVDRLVKSLSFSGRLTPEMEKNERSTASDPPTSRKHR